MALPLPKLLPDMPEEGWLMAGAKNRNALRKQNLENEYYGATQEANALSKLAYANLMGPQFVAKLLQNPDLVGNLTEKQKGSAVSDVYGAGMGQGGANAIAGSARRSGGGLLDMLVNVLTKGNSGGTAPQSQAPQNALAQSPETPQSSAAPLPALPPKTPAEAAEGQMPVEPQTQQNPQFEEWKPGDPLPPPAAQRNKTFAEKAGEHKGVIEEGKEAGILRAKDVKELNDTVLAGENSDKTYQNLIQDVASPAFENIRNVPLAQQHELAYYAKEGTKKEQQMIGDFLTNAGQVVVDTSQKFSGAFRKGEQALINTMKVNPSDTIDVAKGKLEALAYTNRFLTERARLTSKYMEQYHLSKGEALQQADKLLKGEHFREDIHDMLNPTVTIKNPKSGEIVTIPVSEARKHPIKGL